MRAKPIIRCSQLDQFLECPASYTLQQIVAPIDREDSCNGTWLHWTSAKRMVAELGAWPPADGLPEPKLPASFKIPFASEWVSDFYVEHIRRSLMPNWSLEVEVPLAFEFDRFILSGHIDALAVSHDGTESSGSDLKTGYKAADRAENNEQLGGYIVLLKRAYPNLLRSAFEIVQPRAREDEGEQRISSVIVEGADLDALPDALEKRINAALDRIDDLNTGPRQCRWCSAALQCPAAIEERESMRMKLTVPALAAIKRDPNDAVLGDWVVSAKVLEQPIEDARQVAHERLAKVGMITAGCGVRIEQSEQNGSYSVTNPIGLYDEICKTLPTAERAKILTPSVTRLKDALARVLNIPKSGKAATTAESIFDSRFRQHMEQGKRRIFKFLT